MPRIADARTLASSIYRRAKAANGSYRLPSRKVWQGMAEQAIRDACGLLDALPTGLA